MDHRVGLHMISPLATPQPCPQELTTMHPNVLPTTWQPIGPIIEPAAHCYFMRVRARSAWRALAGHLRLGITLALEPDDPDHAFHEEMTGLEGHALEQHILNHPQSSYTAGHLINLTVPHRPIPAAHVALADHTEKADAATVIAAAGLIAPTRARVALSRFADAPLWRLLDPTLLDADRRLRERHYPPDLTETT